MMTTPDLTFTELRLANMVHPHKPPDFVQMLDMLQPLPDSTLALALADMVIHVDWLAASRGIDLAQAIRNQFAVGASP